MSTDPPRARLVPLALFGAVTAISFAAIFFRKAASTHPLGASAVRLAIAAVLLAPWSIRALRAANLGAAELRAAAAGGALYALHFGSWVWSLGLTTVAASVTLVTATPLLLAIVSLITGRDRPDSHLWLALGLALIGVLLIGGADFGSSPDALLGDALALLGAAAMAGYMIVARGLRPDLNVLGFMGVVCGSGAGVLVVVALATGVSLAPSSTEALVYLGLAALLPQIVGHGLLTWSLRHTTPVVVGIATVGEPVGASILGYLWLDETVQPTVAIGCAIVLGAVVLAATRRRRAPS